MSDNSGVPSTEVHVADGGPRARFRIVDFHALANERAVVTADGIQQTSEDSYAWGRLNK